MGMILNGIIQQNAKLEWESEHKFSDFSLCLAGLLGAFLLQILANN
jgi:hypothetical protein